MNGFERRKERKKEYIRQAALELFTTHGIKKISIAEIADKAKVSQVTIYNYFGSKDELVRDAFYALMQRRLKEDTEIIEGEQSFPEIVEHFLTEKVGELRAFDSDFLKTIMSEDPEIRQMAADFTNNSYIPLMLRFIDRGRKEGYIQNGISDTAILYYINMFRAGKHSETFMDFDKSKHFLKEIITLFFYGLLGKTLEKE